MSNDRIQLGHGGGGRLSRDLVAREILSRFGHGPLASLGDGALLPLASGHATSARSLAFSTDGFVVKPVFFPGGNIGDLAVYGTVNDLACCGAKPRWLSLGLILEEGLPMETLRRVLDSIRKAADDCAVQIVTGDTKVVGRGQCEQIYVHTSGVGEVLEAFKLGPQRVAVGDVVLVSGPLGDHGMAVLSAREGLQAGALVSDTGPVHRLVLALEDLAEGVRFFRDPTRGGLAAVLNELCDGQTFGVALDERIVPFSAPARALAEVLGIDLLHVASEGRLVLVCDAAMEQEVLARWRRQPEGSGAQRIGVIDASAGRVTLRTSIGGRRLVDMPQGELLPRIC